MDKIMIAKDKIIEAVKVAYDLSVPMGLGFLHAEDGRLTDEEAESLIDFDSNRVVVRMDYVKGRCCKFTIFKDENGEFFTNSWWGDHSRAAVETLMDKVGAQ